MDFGREVVPAWGSEETTMTDLDQIRAWRSSAPGRALVLHGPDGRSGVTLVAFSGLTRREATYATPAEASAALRDEAVTWQRRVYVDGTEASDAPRLRFIGDGLYGAMTRGFRAPGPGRPRSKRPDNGDPSADPRVA